MRFRKMLARETVLRQRYSLSFLTTTLLIALTTQSSLAFSITPPTEYLPVKLYITPPNVGMVSLYPTSVTSITRGGTTGFLQTLSQAFSNWTFNSAPNDLAGTFQLEKYLAKDVFDSTPVVGGEIELLYKPGNGDPILDNSLKWIQRVVNNHSATPLYMVITRTLSTIFLIQTLLTIHLTQSHKDLEAFMIFHGDPILTKIITG